MDNGSDVLHNGSGIRVSVRAATATKASSSAGLGFGVSGKVRLLGGFNFGSILHRSGTDQSRDGRSGRSAGGYGQIVGQDTEAVGVGDVADADLFAIGIDVCPAAHLVTPSIAEVGGSLAGMDIAERSLAELILGMELRRGDERCPRRNWSDPGVHGAGEWMEGRQLTAGRDGQTY